VKNSLRTQKTRTLAPHRWRWLSANPHFRKTFLAEIQELFAQILLLAQEAGVFKLGSISRDGGKIHAVASKQPRERLQMGMD
jgi:hypothetical protein